MLTSLLMLLAAFNVQDKADPETQALERINHYRKTAGLQPVVLDPTLTKGCAAHAKYLAQNAKESSAQGLGMHKEDPKLPGYSEEGLKAAGASVIYPGSTPLGAVDGWMATLFHRIPLLDPTLTKIGFGYASGFVVVDTIQGRGGKESTKPVLYPADKQQDVPLSMTPELPRCLPEGKNQSAGYPITVLLAGSVKQVTASLKDENDKEVAVWLSTPEEPAEGHGQFQRNTICLIAKSPLKRASTYTVTVTATVDKKEWTETWSFTTAKK